MHENQKRRTQQPAISQPSGQGNGGGELRAAR